MTVDFRVCLGADWATEEHGVVLDSYQRIPLAVVT
jgi:hypothetical protein